MKKLLIVFITLLLISMPSQGRTKSSLSSNTSCDEKSVLTGGDWVHDWYFYWPYHYYGNHHPYYWHDGFHLSFGG